MSDTRHTDGSRGRDTGTDTTTNQGKDTQRDARGRGDDLRDSPMMARLLDALDKGTDIGHYGRLTFVMVGRFFLDDGAVVEKLQGQPDMSETDARALVLQVKGHGYNPPKRETILQWQRMQDFQICPDGDDPNGCNVYSELRFPDGIYENIGEFWEEQAEAQEHQSEAQHA